MPEQEEDPKLPTDEQFKNAPILWGVPGEQMGLPYLAGQCPKCTQKLALSGPGYGACMNCNTWLEFRDVTTRGTPAATAVEAKREE